MGRLGSANRLTPVDQRALLHHGRLMLRPQVCQGLLRRLAQGDLVPITAPRD